MSLREQIEKKRDQYKAAAAQYAQTNSPYGAQGCAEGAAALQWVLDSIDDMPPCNCFTPVKTDEERIAAAAELLGPVKVSSFKNAICAKAALELIHYHKMEL